MRVAEKWKMFCLVNCIVPVPGNRKEWFSEPGKGMRGILGRNWNQPIANPQERSKFTLLASSKSLLVFVKGQIQLEAKEQESPVT